MADLLGIGSAIQGVTGLGKAVFGGIQAIKGRKQFNTLMKNRPQYDISQGYLDAYKTYQKLAGSEMPGYGLMQDQIGQATAKATSTAEQGAMSSSQFMKSALGSQEKELDAIRNLGIMNQQWQSQQQQNLAGAQNQMGQLQDTQFQTNKLDPWNMKANMAAERQGAGMSNLFGGISDMGVAAMNYAGTKSYMDVMKGMYPQGGGTGQPTAQSSGINYNFRPNEVNTTLAQGVQPGSTFNPSNFIKKGNGFY
jgi:hypothetical protein